MRDKITIYQLDLMKHTMSDGGRNWFGTGYDTKDSAEFEKLVKLKLATSEKAVSWMGDDVIYRLTESGKLIVKGSYDY